MIKNREELLSHGNIRGRKIAIDVIEHTLKEVNLYNQVKKLVHIKDKILTVNSLNFDTSKIGEIYVVGAGKSTFWAGKALEQILGERIRGGVIIDKRGGVKSRLKRIEVIEAGHPIPDEAGLDGARKILDIAKRAGEKDIVFVVVTGGSSALMPLPAEGISLEDKREITRLLLNSGASIEEINAVRKHISAIKGGRLAKYIHPAKIITLTFATIDPFTPQGQLMPWPDVTLPDPTTFSDAISVLKKYKLWDKVPDSIRAHLNKGLMDPSLETPKAKDFEGVSVYTINLGDRQTLCEAAKNRAEKLGFNSVVLSTLIEGESREAGIVLAGIAKEIERYKKPFKPPCVLISSGETTVTVKDEHGKGGRNQEFVLGFALKINESNNIVVAAIDTDGADGPTSVAGGIADGYTIKRAKEMRIDIYENLQRNNSFHVLNALNDTIITGPTGTHLQQLRVIVIGG